MGEKEILEKLYWNDELNQRQIGDFLGISRWAVLRRMKKYGMYGNFDFHAGNRMS